MYILQCYLNVCNLLYLLIYILLEWIKFYQQRWVIASLNRCMSKINRETWMKSPNNTNVAESAHALNNRYGKGLKLVTAIIQYVLTY